MSEFLQIRHAHKPIGYLRALCGCSRRSPRLKILV